MNAPAPSASVTVVVPFYGRPEPVIEMITGLLETAPECLRAVVISDDHSPRPFPQEAFDDARVTVLRRETNGGFGAAVNTGLARVLTPLALVLNSDVRITGEQVQRFVEAAQPWQPVVAGPAVVSPDGTSQWTGRHFPTVGHQVVEWLTPLARWRHLPMAHTAVGHDVVAARAAHVTPVDWVMGAVLLLPVAQVRGVGGFDESFHMNCEEVDLQRRLRADGVAAVVIPEVTVVHEGGGSSEAGLRRRWLVDSRFRYAPKWGRPGVLRASLRAATVVNFVVNGLRRLAGTDVEPLTVLHREWELLR